MLTGTTPDVVVICIPDLFQADQTIVTLEAGSDVVLEKPLAIDAEGCRRRY